MAITVCKGFSNDIDQLDAYFYRGITDCPILGYMYISWYGTLALHRTVYTQSVRTRLICWVKSHLLYGNSGYGVLNIKLTISLDFSKLKREGPQKVIKASVNNSVISKLKIEVRGVFQSEKQMESRCQIKFSKSWILDRANF